VSTCTNSITLEDRSTETWTYQIYLHLAYNSIPIELKQVGVAVNQGQFIGNVDDTGYSTGHHVHFMVVAKDTLYKTSSGYYFGRAEDITFRDVFINWDEATQGGRPRRTDEATTYGGEGQNYYISGNAEQKFEYIFTLFFN
jgi:murein DD-endopeptidase MepM/ murein hydrolase activator NlpD